VRTEDFDYELPTALIAQEPVEPRDACRLMVVDRASGQIDDRVFSDLPEYLSAGDVLVVNETKVLPARLTGKKPETGGAAELLLLRERYEDTWECLAKPGRRLKPGANIVFGQGELTGLVVDVLEESGGRLVRLTARDGRVIDAVRRLGEVPLPPYIVRPLEDPSQYQTVFARDERSAAAPTAGLHFTARLLDTVRESGVRVVPVELDVGIDTFRPVAEEDPRDHHMHTEYFRVSERAAADVNDARASGGRVFAVGTTAVRALESAYDAQSGEVVPVEGRTDLFILPGRRFEVVDALVTNFHVPRSTLLMLVSAFAGRELVMRAYQTAVAERYRLLSFGDAMLIT
jgi:S-adenosylmethionine:tRNA ribosyltransferase-isomerase